MQANSSDASSMDTLQRKSRQPLRRMSIYSKIVIVVFVLLPMSAFCTTRTWTGTSATSANWSDAENWGGVIPVDEDDLVFPADAARLDTINDLANGTNVSLITFTGGGYSIAGNSIRLGQLIQNLSSSGTNVVGVPIVSATGLLVMMGGSASSTLNLTGVISGSAILQVVGSSSVQTVLQLSGANTYAGGTLLSSISLAVGNDNAFGSGQVTSLDSSSTIRLNGFSIANQALFGLGTGDSTAVTGNGTWRGMIALSGPAGFGSDNFPGLKFTGDFIGTSGFTAPVSGPDSIVMLDNNTSLSALTTVGAGKLYINGIGTDVTIASDATLGGTGRVRNVKFAGTGGKLSPGVNGPGTLKTANVEIPAGNSLEIELNGYIAGLEYDQLDVTSYVTIGGTLNATLGFDPAPGTIFRIIKTSGGVSGNFTGLPEGSRLTIGGKQFRISYLGGNGRDVTLEAIGNIVYKPLPPCRLMDTRAAAQASGVRGPITGGALRYIPGFIATGSNWGPYGGNEISDCGVNDAVGTDVQAIAIVATILAPNFDAYLGMGDVGDLSSTLSTVALNFTAGQGISTLYVVPQERSKRIYFALPNQLSANLIFDVIGYFATSDTTKLECMTLPSPSSPVPGSGGVGDATSPSCGTNYTLLSGSCNSDSLAMKLNSSRSLGQSWFCSAMNAGAPTGNLTAAATCCRVPGK